MTKIRDYLKKHLWLPVLMYELETQGRTEMFQCVLETNHPTALDMLSWYYSTQRGFFWKYIREDIVFVYFNLINDN